jgi:uncharacterized protein (TIGR02246 family)
MASLPATRHSPRRAYSFGPLPPHSVRAKVGRRGRRAIRLLTLAVLATLTAPAAVAGPREDALQVLARWTDAFAASDVDAIVALHAPDALFMGTGSKDVVTETAGIRRYFEDALLTRRPRAAPISSQHVVVLSDDAVLVTGLNDSTGVQDGKPFSNPGRVTFVIARRGADWKVVHFHRSAMPR